MTDFLTEDFLLHTETAKRLYHEHAENMPIYDFHCHLPPGQIADDHRFENITQAWLYGDHYKWRAMRTNGVDESLITGQASDREKFSAWAQTVPATIGNPLYHWTHLELKRPFGISDVLLGPDTEAAVWDRSRELLAQDGYSTRGIMKRMNVRLVCTTDDPADDLKAHETAAGDNDFAVTVVPAFRPDAALRIERADEFRAYMKRLGESAGIEVNSYHSLLSALQKRLEYFHAHGARISDHALLEPIAEAAPESVVKGIFEKVAAGGTAEELEVRQFKTAVLLFLGSWYKKNGWVFQIHLSALRNNSSRMLKMLGPDTGFDSIADKETAQPLSRFLDMLDREDNLPKTIIYTLDATKNDVIATMIGNFQDGSLAGKMQFGSGWWFHDQKDGMLKQMTSLANMGLLSRFVGMLTDSRSFLSYPRHEYFRRILCNLIGGWVEEGEAPRDMKLLGGMVEDICWNNAYHYFGIALKGE
jgi:glucuronate isomerase